MRPAGSVHSEAHGGREDSVSIPVSPCAPSNQGWGCPFPPKVSAFLSSSGWEARVAFGGGGAAGLWQVRGWPSSSPQPPPSLGSGWGERGAGWGRVDTHRPKLPVWASCRMRCSCLFIILGAGWGLQGHGAGRGQQPPAQPASASASALAPDGWAALSASWASALPLAPASPLAAPPPAPRSLLSPSLGSRSPCLPPPTPRPLEGSRECRSTRRPAVHRLCARLLPAQPRWREAGKPAPATAPAPGSCPTYRPPAQGINNFCTSLKEERGFCTCESEAKDSPL